FLRSLQLRVFLHKLFESEPWKLYRNLGAFSFAFPAVHHTFAILGMSHALSGTKCRPAGLLLRRLGRSSGQGKLLPARSEELGDVVDRVVLGPGVTAGACSRARRLSATCRRFVDTLVFIFVAVVRLAVDGTA